MLKHIFRHRERSIFSAQLMKSKRGNPKQNQQATRYTGLLQRVTLNVS